MKLRRFTDAGVAKTRAYLAAVKESGDVENVTLNGQPFTRAALISSPGYTDAAAKSYFLDREKQMLILNVIATLRIVLEKYRKLLAA